MGQNRQLIDESKDRPPCLGVRVTVRLWSGQSRIRRVVALQTRLTVRNFESDCAVLVLAYLSAHSSVRQNVLLRMQGYSFDVALKFQEESQEQALSMALWRCHQAVGRGTYRGNYELDNEFLHSG